MAINLQASMQGAIDELLQGQISGSIQSLGRQPVIESLTVTENGTYTPESGVDGFNRVVVSLSGNIWIDNTDDNITVKIEPDGNVVVYLKGLTINQYATLDVMPTNCKIFGYVTNVDSRGAVSYAYDSDLTTRLGNVGFYNSRIQLWSTGGYLTSGTVWAVINLYYGNAQTNPYEAPTYD